MPDTVTAAVAHTGPTPLAKLCAHYLRSLTCFTGVSIEPEEGELLKSPELGVFASASPARHRPCSVLHAHGAARAAAQCQPMGTHSAAKRSRGHIARLSHNDSAVRGKLAERSESVHSA
jgi:hypothetical protein